MSLPPLSPGPSNSTPHPHTPGFPSSGTQTARGVRYCLSVYALCASLAGPATVTPQDAGVRRAPDANDIRVAFVSDTQTPLPPERLFLRGHRNTEARALLMDAMLEFRPRAVVHLGDLVALGFHESSWAAIDTFMNRLRERRIGFYPVLGNHELMFYPEAGETRFRERFPYACPTGYVRRFGWMAVVLLNSNMQNLGPAAADSQLVWYGQTLRELDADSGIGLVVVGTHHSPFTNSIVVPPATDVQAHFVPPFLRARKARLFLSGHAHAAEHFREGGKDFLVIGGGGGLQQPLLTGGERRWKDHFPRHTATRMFHYLTCAVGKDSAVFTIRMLEQDRTGFVDALRAAFGRASGKSSGELDNSD